MGNEDDRFGLPKVNPGDSDDVLNKVYAPYPEGHSTNLTSAQKKSMSSDVPRPPDKFNFVPGALKNAGTEPETELETGGKRSKTRRSKRSRKTKKCKKKKTKPSRRRRRR